MTPTDKARALATYLDDTTKVARTFDWAAANCCHFGAGWVERIEGFNPMTGLALTPDRRAAMALVRSLGGTLSAAWSTRMNRPALQANLAQVGDLVLLALAPTTIEQGFVGMHRAVGICAGRTVVCLDARGNCVHLPSYTGVCCWRVGEPA